MSQQTENEMELVAEAIGAAISEGLLDEFVWSLVNQARANPNAELGQVLFAALNEWDIG